MNHVANKPLKAYRVFQCSPWGHGDEVKYYQCPIQAEKDFWERMRKGITSKNLPTVEDVCDDKVKPWSVKFNSSSLFSGVCKAVGVIHYWDRCSYEYDEWDINCYEIVIDEISIA